MSDRDLRRRIAVNRSRKTAKPSPSPMPSSRRISRPIIGGRPAKLPEHDRILKRSKSEPSLRGTVDDRSGPAAVAATAEEEEGVLYRPSTCADIFSTPEILVPRSPNSEGYNKEAKVVVNVIVEGSPGPIRTMVKLGSKVEEIIKLVVKKYNEEGRTPPLDKDAASTCELHHSYFSLRCLSKSDIIGDVGNRSFYLRKSSSFCSHDSKAEKSSLSLNSDKMMASTLPFLPSFIDRKIKKIIRRTWKLWKVFGCMQCSG